MMNKGRSQARFRNNPLERKFAKAWEQQNTTYLGNLNGRGTLDFMLAEKINHPAGEVTPRDREVAATVIQWLGSSLGQSFLAEIAETKHDTRTD